MSPVPSERSPVVPAVIGAVLLGAFAFLFLKTEASDVKGDTRALALLHELKAMDARRDADARQLTADIASAPASRGDRAAMADRVLRELEHEGAIASEIPELRAGMAAKAFSYAALRSAHDKSAAAWKRMDEALANAANAANAARLRNPASAPHAVTLGATIESLRAALSRASIDDTATVASAAAPRLATLALDARAVDPAASSAALLAQAKAGAFIEAREAEANAWQRYAYLTVPRIAPAAQMLGAAVENSLDEQARWRAYLFAYAAALLVGVGYLALRVAAAQRALQRANDALERRVSERTRELSEALEHLKESEAQLVHTEKMSSLGQLAAGVAHEINTPLAYVKASLVNARGLVPGVRSALEEAERLLAMLQSESADPDALQSSFEKLANELSDLRERRVLEDVDALTNDGLHGIERIAELVDNMRNFARLDRSRVASFDVNEGVASTLIIARPALRGIEVAKCLGAVPAIHCSPSQVNQVILNLVTNAAQAIEGSAGRIVVTTRPSGADAVAIEVEDNGKGIPSEIRTRIFDPFFTTKEVGKGTGLGLAIANKIVAQHGGRIDLASEPGRTVFTVTLPVHPPAAEQPQRETEAVS